MKQQLVISLLFLFGIIGYAKSAQSRRSQSSLKVSLDVVLVPVTVTDSHNRPVEGLRAENFQIWEDKIEQRVQYVSAEDTPLSIGLVFDVSGSMRNVLGFARSAASTFLKTGNPEDEYFLVEFSDRPHIAQRFTRDLNRLTHDLSFHGAEGFTAFFDALYLALENVRLGNHPRKVLLMITDGGDNHSRYTFDDVKGMLRESDTQLYGIGLGFQPYPKRKETGRELLQELAELTGGRAVFPISIEQLDQICAEISMELKSQYVLGYVPLNTATDGKWRKLRVKVNPSTGMTHLTVRAKAGYYATKMGLP